MIRPPSVVYTGRTPLRYLKKDQNPLAFNLIQRRRTYRRRNTNWKLLRNRRQASTTNVGHMNHSHWTKKPNQTSTVLTNVWLLRKGERSWRRPHEVIRYTGISFRWVASENSLVAEPALAAAIPSALFTRFLLHPSRPVILGSSCCGVKPVCCSLS